MSSYYPLFLNLKGKRALIFGGGNVALRKAKSFVKSGAKLTVISRAFIVQFLKLSKQHKIKLKKGSQIPSLSNFSLVVCATSDSSFNRKVARLCQKKKILVNVADDRKESSFIVPSSIQKGNLQIAISTGGASPFLAKTLRKKLTAELSGKYGNLVHYLNRGRAKIKKTIRSPKKRKAYFKRLVKTQLKKMTSK